ncbi:AsmA family protein [Dechloromonas sp. XY25]|uniref:AsmA family protein n=1 Tax=Dechloromonas hankyongensis TaxID=2908002 RepID=A0ABS9K262_9RHOO|nr:AsmA family protein [Dechloromonas hankyongensis]MCG2577259.1 AsmA family protein [Dechloromonas hankyongensis]
MSTRRRLLWSLPVLLIAALAASELSGWFFLRTPAEAILSSKLGREVAIATPFRLHFRGTIRLEVGGLRISAPADFAVPHLIDAQGLTLSLRYGDLLALREDTQALRLATLAAEQIDAWLIRLADGRATWQFAEKSQRPPPTVDRLGVAQGRIVFRDAILATDLNARISSDENGAARATSAEISGRFRERPLRASITLPTGLPGALPEAAGEAIAAEGKVDYGGLNLSFAGSFGVSDLRGTAAIKGPSLSVLGRLFDVTLPTTAPFSLEANIVKDSPIWQITVSHARIGKSDLAGKFAYDTRPQPPRLDGELTGKNFVLADLAPALGTRNEEGRIVRPSGGRTLPDRRLDLPSLTRLNAGIAVNLERVDLGSAFRQPITPLRAKLTLDGGRMTLTDIDASTAQGRLAGTFAIDARPARPEWRADLAWDNLRLDQWLASAKSGADDIRRRGDSNPPPWFTGSLHGRTQLVGHGQSTAELLGSLDGRATFFVRNGTLSHLALEALGLDVAQGLGLLFKGDDRQPVECAIIDVDAKNGLLTPRVALMATPVTVVLIDGNINFASEQLNLRLTAKPQNLSPLTLRSPFRLTGSFADPTLRPEATPLAAKAVAAMGLALLNPLAAIIPFIDLGDTDTTTCSQALAGRAPKVSTPAAN